ncbi:alcohol dehydrogenase GroES-like domain-containing protein [Rhizodiscina lignyota]|uniref:Alcohol dehydrogenase GroES-like domain-containing protein n=1 Tax=Rhizodiscina lignyota TaxID=1504668 RepID=A0A9P4IIU8_9PEZI|nr:alcohol dehydrogenase GroES-like domain-containing protein [Rhizodiscina lignyota]
MSNRQAVIPEATGAIVVRDVPTYVPGEGEILVKNHITASIPLEAKLQKFAFMPLAYPADTGIAFAGTVEEVGPGVTRFKKGDRVAVARAMYLFGDSRTGANQRLVIAKEPTAAHIGPDGDFAEAASAISNLATTVPAISIVAGLDRPSKSPNPANKDTKVLVYGGSSQLGRLTIQYLQQAGYTVITTSSPANRDDVVALNPEYVTNHSANPNEVTADLIAHGPYAVVFDAVSLPPTQAILGPVMLENKKHGKTNVVLATGPAETAPEGVEFRFESFSVLLQMEEKNADVNKWFFEEYVPGVFDGTFKLAPTRLENVPGGLNAFQGILDRILGVSGIKLVYNPWE